MGANQSASPTPNRRRWNSLWNVFLRLAEGRGSGQHLSGIRKNCPSPDSSITGEPGGDGGTFGCSRGAVAYTLSLSLMTRRALLALILLCLAAPVWGAAHRQDTGSERLAEL